MYLFIFTDDSYYIATGYNFHYALANAYNYVGTSTKVNAVLFEDITAKLPDEKAADVFNALAMIAIKRVYSRLEKTIDFEPEANN